MVTLTITSCERPERALLSLAPPRRRYLLPPPFTACFCALTFRSRERDMH
jgi:hypothetical protein